jgi:hypothetical protein
MHFATCACSLSLTVQERDLLNTDAAIETHPTSTPAVLADSKSVAKVSDVRDGPTEGADPEFQEGQQNLER